MVVFTGEQLLVAGSGSDLLLVEALAGTGKTETVALLVEERVRGGVAPSEILCVTFTNASVGQLRSRLLSRGVFGVRVQTIDSFALDVVRGLFYSRGWDLVVADYRVLIRDLLRDFGLRDGAGDVNAFYNLSVLNWFGGGGEGVVRGLDGVSADDVGLLLSEYDVRKRQLGGLDFVDIGLLAGEIGCKDLGYSLVVVDEAQDCSPAHLKLLESFGRVNMVFVGDQFQSIYDFAGVSPELFNDYCGDWDRLSLSQSFRSGDNVLSVVNGLFGGLSLRGVDGLDGDVKLFDGIGDAVNGLISLDGSKGFLGRTRYDLFPVVRELRGLGKNVGVSWDGSSSDGFEFFASTIHASKGLEFDNVGVFNLGSSGFNSGGTVLKDVDERLLYVALSRARRNLFLHSSDGSYPSVLGV